MNADLKARLADLGADVPQRRADGWWVEARLADVLAVAQALADKGGRLITITGLPLPDGESEILYHYAVGESGVSVRTRTVRGALPSITPIAAAAGWIEREVADLYGVEFEGHPDPRRLVRPPQLPPGFFREDSNAAPAGETSLGETVVHVRHPDASRDLAGC